MAVTDPCFIYYPDPLGTREVIDFAEPLSDLHEIPMRDVEDAYRGDGSFARVVHASRYRVRIILERFTSRALERSFASLSAHLERGGYVAFSNVRSKIFQATRNTSDVWERGDSYVQHTGNMWTCWYSSATMAANDEIVIETANPEALREYTTISSMSLGTRINLTDTLRNTYSSDPDIPALVRYRDFWPTLRLPKDQLGKPIVTHDHRIAWTLDVTLEYDLTALTGALSGWTYDGGQIGLGTDTTSWSRSSGSTWSLDRFLTEGITQRSHGTRGPSMRGTLGG